MWTRFRQEPEILQFTLVAGVAIVVIAVLLMVKIIQGQV